MTVDRPAAGKELFVHPKDAFGLLIQFAEFNPLDWIEPGYIPQAYREFTPPRETDRKGDRVEVRRVETRSGSEVEIRRGDQVVRIPEAQLEELSQALRVQMDAARDAGETNGIVGKGKSGS